MLTEIKDGLPATLSLAIGAGIIWLLTSIVVGTLAAIKAGQVHRPRADGAVDGRRLDAAVLPRRRAHLLPRLQAGLIFPLGGYVPFTQSPSQWLWHMIAAVVHPVGAVHRLLLARAALDDPRHDQRGLRPHRAGQGAVRAPGAATPHPAQQPDSDHLAVGARRRAGDRRRRDPDRDGLQPARRRPARRDRDRQPRHHHAAR